MPTHSKVVALTIDDAPHPAVTPKILEALQALGVKATFFVIGSQAEQWPQLLLAVAVIEPQVWYQNAAPA